VIIQISIFHLEISLPTGDIYKKPFLLYLRPSMSILNAAEANRDNLAEADEDNLAALMVLFFMVS
jgi:hypothetical protein